MHCFRMTVMTSHCSAIQDPRFEREKTGKEYTFQFLISFLTQHIAGLSELLAAKWPLVMRGNHRTLYQLTDTKKLVTMWSMKIDQILPSPNQLCKLFRDHSDRWPGGQIKGQHTQHCPQNLSKTQKNWPKKSEKINLVFFGQAARRSCPNCEPAQ